MLSLFQNSRDVRKSCLVDLKLLLLFIFACQSQCHETTGGGMRGSDCKSDVDCNQSQFLRCVGTNGTCDCDRERGEAWIQEEGSCMIREGEACDTNGVTCITNSSCVTGSCECDDGFLRTGDTKCGLGYGSDCSPNNDMCSSRYSLVCSKVKTFFECQCIGEGIDYVWDEDRQKCVSTAGGTCNAIDNFQTDISVECIRNAECRSTDVGFRCLCKSGFMQTLEGTCMLKYGERCDISIGLDCNRHQFLTCQQGRCECMFYGQMKYDTDTEQCHLLAGESCSVSRRKEKHEMGNAHKEQPSCVRDAECKPQRSGSQRGLCTCPPDMQTTSDKVCSRYNKGHGLPCSTNTDCDKTKFLECVFDERKGSHCECFTNDMYFDGKECRVRAGRNCTENKLCPTNAYCEGNWCVCQEGYKPSNEGCIPEGRHKLRNSLNPNFSDQNTGGMSTSDPGDVSCDFYVGSVEWPHCKCQQKSFTHIWIPETQSCLALVGINCLQDTECVPHAICDIQAQICQCSPLARTTRDRTCMLRSENTKLANNADCDTNIHSLKSVSSLAGSYKLSPYVRSCLIISIFIAFSTSVLQ